MGIYGAAEDARRQVASDRRSWLDHLSSPPSAWAWPLRLSERALSAPAPSDERRHLVGAFRVPDVSPDRMTLHGFRTMTLTILDEVLGFRPDFHRASTRPRGARSQPTGLQPHGVPAPERRVMMQHGPNYLDRLAAGGEIEAKQTGP